LDSIQDREALSYLENLVQDCCEPLAILEVHLKSIDKLIPADFVAVRQLHVWISELHEMAFDLVQRN
jgi:hypothetical protein